MALGRGLVTEASHLVVLSSVRRGLEVDLLPGDRLVAHHHVAQREVGGRHRARGGGERRGGNSGGETPGSDCLVSPPSDQDLDISW